MPIQFLVTSQIKCEKKLQLNYVINDHTSMLTANQISVFKNTRGQVTPFLISEDK